jgi:hypothetical protein
LEGTETEVVGERLADVVATLIQVRAIVEGGAVFSQGDAAALQHELASVNEFVHLITRDLRDGWAPGILGARTA